MNITDITRENISYALTSKFASGDIDKAMELLQLQKSSFAGTILPHNPNTAMLGAENRGNVTCYLDALLFAMFSKLEAFECMLKNEFTSEPQRQLAALLRLWVNMLRTGKLIQINMVRLPFSAPEILESLGNSNSPTDATYPGCSGRMWMERGQTARATGHI